MLMVLNWLKDNLFGQTALFLGLIVAIGMMLQKKKLGKFYRDLSLLRLDIIFLIPVQAQLAVSLW